MYKNLNLKQHSTISRPTSDVESISHSVKAGTEQAGQGRAGQGTTNRLSSQPGLAYLKGGLKNVMSILAQYGGEWR